MFGIILHYCLSSNDFNNFCMLHVLLYTMHIYTMKFRSFVVLGMHGKNNATSTAGA